MSTRNQISPSQYHSLYQFFYRNLKHAFADLCLSNRIALDYIASVLTYFARTENLYRIKQFPDFRLEAVVETLLQIETTGQSDDLFSVNEEILIRKHIGDFTLFMSGIFREYVQRLGFLEFYQLEGSRSYHRVYEYAYTAYGKEAEVFEDLSRQFENYSGALDYLKKVYFYYPDIDEAIHQLLKNLQSW